MEKQDTYRQAQVLFFSPEALIKPHFFIQCLTAKTLQSLRHSVIFMQCHGDMRRCPAMDLRQVPFEYTAAEVEPVCEECHRLGKSTLGDLGLEYVEMGSLLGQKQQNLMAELIGGAPEDLTRFEYEQVPFGKLTLQDVCLQTKISEFRQVEPAVRRLWLDYIHGSMACYLATKELLERQPIGRILHFNDYGTFSGARMAGREKNLPVFTVAQAPHLLSDCRKFIFLPENFRVTWNRLWREWSRWRDLHLPPDLVSTIGDDVTMRLGSTNSLIYSPPKNGKASDLFSEMMDKGGKRLLVAYTSSLDEHLCNLIFEEIFDQPKNFPQPFTDQIDWLDALCRFAAERDDMHLVVRIHPREGEDPRVHVASQHYQRIKARFLDRDLPNVTFVRPEDPVSSYDLMEMADLVLTGWSTVGLESARMGIPVLMAFQGITFPHDQYIRFEPTREAYFQSLAKMMYEPGTSLETISQAYRCHYMFKLSRSLDFGDLVPGRSLGALPPFHTPREAHTLEQVIFEGKSVVEINHQRLLEQQSPDIIRAEREALVREAVRLIHFLHTGEDSPGVELAGFLELIGWDPKLIADRVRAKAFGRQSLLITRGQRTYYLFRGQVYSRFSPLSARLASMFAEREPLPEVAQPSSVDVNRNETVERALGIMEAGTRPLSYRARTLLRRVRHGHFLRRGSVGTS